MNEERKAARNVIQVRADEDLLDKLMVYSERLHMPISSLVRAWIEDRLASELDQERSRVRLWQQERFAEIQCKQELFDQQGPRQIIHILPLTPGLNLHVENISLFRGFLRPIERTDDFDSRINLFGFETKKIFRDQKDGKVNAYVQVFCTGQLESVRILQRSDVAGEFRLFGDHLENDLVNALVSYMDAYRHLKVSLPFLILVSFIGMKGYKIDSSSNIFEQDGFVLQDRVVNDWQQVACPDACAQTLKPALDQLWNGAGVARSRMFSEDGKSWYGPLAGLL